jgi:hypothetical protein
VYDCEEVLSLEGYLSLQDGCCKVGDPAFRVGDLVYDKRVFPYPALNDLLFRVERVYWSQGFSRGSDFSWWYDLAADRVTRSCDEASMIRGPSEVSKIDLILARLDAIDATAAALQKVVDDALKQSRRLVRRRRPGLQ